MKILQNAIFLFMLSSMILLTGCQDQEENNLTLDLPEEATENDISTTKINSDIEVTFFSYNQEGEEIVINGTSSVDEESIVDNNTKNVDGKDEIGSTCCLIENLVQVPPNLIWPYEFRVDLGEAWRINANSWVFRLEVFFNGEKISSADWIDAWVGPRCDASIATGLPFGFSIGNLDVGYCCPVDLELKVTRMYRLNNNKQLHECSSESINVRYTGPRTGNPCC